MSQTITFREVAVRGSKSVKCAGGCGRTLRRQRKFWQTLNPFNKNKSGEVKSAVEIQAELRVERDLWLTEPETCSHCTSRRGEGEVMSDDINERKDFVVEVRMVFLKSVSRADLYDVHKGSTVECAKSLIGTDRRIPKDFTVTVAGLADDGQRYIR